MKNWFSKFLEQTPEPGRNATRLALVFMIAASLAVLVFAIVAVQSGAWQAYTVVAAFVGFFVFEALVIKTSRQGYHDTSGILLVVAVCYIVLAMTALMGGIAPGLCIALTLVIVEIAFETLPSRKASGAQIAGLLFSIGVFLMDKFAPWNRPSFPAVQYAIPSIAAGTVLTIAFLVVRRVVIWRDLNLARKLIIAFGALFAFGLVIAAIGLLGLNRVQDSYENALAGGVKIQNRADNLNNALLKARRREKDFLLRWQDEGFNNAYISYVVPHSDHIATMKITLQELEELAPVLGRVRLAGYSQDQYTSDIASLNEAVLVYEQSFTQTVTLIEERGFVDTGLEGDFRKSIQEIEALIYDRDGLDPLVITMLQIRRREKDYLLRGDQQYVNDVHELIVELKRETAASDVLTSVEQQEIRRLADEYLVKFDALVEKDKELAASIEFFRAAATDIQTSTDLLAGTGQQLAVLDIRAAEANSAQTLLFSIITVVVVLAASIGLAIALSGQIARPVLQLTSTAAEIATGKFDARVEISSKDEIGILAQTFNTMTARLGEAFEDVRRRAAELATVADVSTATSTILESKRLLEEVVDLTKERFQLYHSHIYLIDEKGENLVLAAGAGEPGRVMVAEGRSIPLDREQSLVARAAREHKGVTVNDVTQAPDFLPNPLLPDTRSELAVPMIAGGNVIGVFDIQSDQVGRFTDSDVNIQITLASQLAVSIQNVRSFEESKKQAALESLVNSIGQKIQRSTSIEETLQVAVRELGMAVGASRVKANISARTDAGN